MGNESSPGFADRHDGESSSLASQVGQLVIEKKHLEAARMMRDIAGIESRRQHVTQQDMDFLLGFVNHKTTEVCVTALEAVKILVAERHIRLLLEKSQLKHLARATLSQDAGVVKQATDVLVTLRGTLSARISTVGTECLLQVQDAAVLIQLFALINTGITDRSPDTQAEMLNALHKLSRLKKSKKIIRTYELDREEVGNLIRLLNHDDPQIASTAATILGAFCDDNIANQNSARTLGATRHLVTLLKREDIGDLGPMVDACMAFMHDHEANTSALLHEEVLSVAATVMACPIPARRVDITRLILQFPPQALVEQRVPVLLAERLLDPEETADTCIHAATALCQVSQHTPVFEPHLVEALVNACQHPTLPVRQWACEGLCHLASHSRKKAAPLVLKADGLTPLLTLIDSVDNTEQQFALGTIRHLCSLASVSAALHPEETYPRLIALLKGSDIATKKHLLTILIRFTKESAELKQGIYLAMRPHFSTLLANSDSSLTDKTSHLLQACLSDLATIKAFLDDTLMQGHSSANNPAIVCVINYLITCLDACDSEDSLSALDHLITIAKSDPAAHTIMAAHPTYKVRIGATLLSGHIKSVTRVRQLVEIISGKRILPRSAEAASAGGGGGGAAPSEEAEPSMLSLHSVTNNRQSMRFKKQLRRRSTTIMDRVTRRSMQLD